MRIKAGKPTAPFITAALDFHRLCQFHSHLNAVKHLPSFKSLAAYELQKLTQWWTCSCLLDALHPPQFCVERLVQAMTQTHTCSVGKRSHTRKHTPEYWLPSGFVCVNYTLIKFLILGFGRKEHDRMGMKMPDLAKKLRKWWIICIINSSHHKKNRSSWFMK